MKVDFERLHWENYPSTDTPLNADNLNRLEEGVAGLYSDVSEIQEELGGGVGEYVTEWLDEHVTPGGSTIVVDDTLSITGAAADAKKTGDEISAVKEDLIPFPISPDNKYGTNGQLLRTKGNGKTEWVDVGLPTDEQTAEAVTAWLNDHPEATTSVEDHSLTYEKLVNGTLGFVTPEMYGAKGDGVTDDTVAFSKALENGNIFLLCKGEYNISSPIEVKSDTIIYGGKFKVGLNVFYATNANNITIENCVFTGTYIGGNASSGDIVLFTECNNISVKNCKFNNIGCLYCIRYNKSDHCYSYNNIINTYAYGGIVHQHGSSNVYVVGNSIINGLATNVGNNRYPIGLSGGSTWTDDLQQPFNLYCFDNYIHDDIGLWEGIDSHGGKNVIIARNIIDGTASGIVVTRWTTVESGAIPPSAEDVLICNNVIKGNTDLSSLTVAQVGIGVSNHSENRAKNIKIYNNIIENIGLAAGTAATVGHGISVGYTDTAEIKDNVINNIGYCGIYIPTELITGVISGNSIDNLSKSENYCINILVTPKKIISIFDNMLGMKSETYIPFRLYRGSESANTGYFHFYNNELGAYSNVLYSHTTNTVFDRYHRDPNGIFRAGKVGDLIFNTNSASGNDVGWICVTAGSTSEQTNSVWKSIGIIA